ncbi:MAG: hypothetical protein A4E57_03756 [Syntrophorhabdaceae bacterium PtaU1.Bin034]|jgi:hypothetical protein|nr:MAG: hypothetical protein A4E57_03756 [Syntrophorhabdaceae bacterium PtaU1.Bin034]
MNLSIGGIVFAALGLSGLFFVGRRRFNRRNMFAVEEFPSYSRAVATRLFESVIGFASWIFLVIGILALFALCLTYVVHR